MKTLITLSVSIIVLAFLGGCSAKKNEIVGTWQCDTGPRKVTFEFQNNGEFTMTIPGISVQGRGTWVRKDDFIVLKTIAGTTGKGNKIETPEDYKVKIIKVTPETLTLDKDGETTSFIRQAEK